VPPLRILGAGGHARVLIDVFRAMGGGEVVLFDDQKPDGTVVDGAPVRGRLADALGPGPAAVALGDNALRRHWALALLASGADLPVLVHPSAAISPLGAIGAGTVVAMRAVLGPGAVLGRFCIVNTMAGVDHDCVVGDGAHIAPAAILCGGVHVGEGALVGAGAILTPGARVSAGGFVKAGTVLAAPPAAE
jgi:UDP-perosamine 4-acetyltransferase